MQWQGKAVHFATAFEIAFGYKILVELPKLARQGSVRLPSGKIG